MLNIVISLIFVFLLYSLFATIIMEVLSAVFALRANNLKKALRNMLDNGDQNYFDAFLEQDSLYKQLAGRFTGKKTPPSYLNPKNFSLMMLNVLERSSNGLPLVEDQIESLPNGSMKDVLKMYYKDAESNIDVFKFNMESWFDNVMDRASGWYKRKIRVILILVGFLIATVFNVDTLEIFGRLQDQALANQLSELAGDLVASEATVEAIGLESLQAEFGKINLNELSIGWSEYTSGVKSFSSTNILMSFLGWIITALAISLGAPFWFDLLNKLVKFRGTGNTKDIIVVQNDNRRSDQQHAVKVIEG